jgi:hypothetical protein
MNTEAVMDLNKDLVARAFYLWGLTYTQNPESFDKDIDVIENEENSDEKISVYLAGLFTRFYTEACNEAERQDVP